MALGAGVAVPFGVFFFSGSDSEVWFGTAAVMAVLLALVTQWRADRYYDAEFGRVVPAQSGQSRGILLGVYFATSGIVAQNIFGDTVPRLWPFVWTAPFLLWIAIRDWPWRTHHLLTAAALALAAAIQLTPEAAANPWSAWSAGLFTAGLSAVPAGFLDHQLLVSVMRRAAAELESGQK